MTKDEALKLALEALELANINHWFGSSKIEAVIAAIKQALAQPVQEPVAHTVIAGALFDFMGYLTSRKERIVLSASDDAAPAADAIRDFATKRGLSLDDAQVREWIDALAQPEQEQKYEKRIAPYSTTLSMLLNTTPPAAQPEQEPSQWRDMVVVNLVREGIDKHRARELADHFAAQRPWQGLTDEEIWSAVSRIGTADSNVNPLIILSDARAIEAKLKGKNYDTART